MRLKEHFKNTNFKEIPEEFYNNYIYGYRKDSEMGLKLLKKAHEKKTKTLKLSKLLVN